MKTSLEAAAMMATLSDSIREKTGGTKDPCGGREGRTEERDAWLRLQPF